MRPITKRLLLRPAACAVVIAFALLKQHFKRLTLRYLRFLVYLQLDPIGYKIPLTHIVSHLYPEMVSYVLHFIQPYLIQKLCFHKLNLIL